MSRDDHYDLGVEHAKTGKDRYKFQDAHLQERYDAGYNAIVKERDRMWLVDEQHVPQRKPKLRY